jgi:two-component system response regulator
MTATPLPPRGRIVIADDDADDQALALEALASHGWRAPVTQVYDGEQLLQLLRQPALAAARSPLLVLLDLNMPRKNGFETLKAMRQDRALEGVPVVVFSTSSAPDDVARSYRLGCNSYVPKPASIQAMHALMGDLLRYWFETSELPRGHAPA